MPASYRIPVLRKKRNRVSCKRSAAQLSYISTAALPVSWGAITLARKKLISQPEAPASAWLVSTGIHSLARRARMRFFPAGVMDNWKGRNSSGFIDWASERDHGRYPARILDKLASCGDNRFITPRNTGSASPEAVRSRCLAADLDKRRASKVLGPLVGMILADAIEEVLEVTACLGLAIRIPEIAASGSGLRPDFGEERQAGSGTLVPSSEPIITGLFTPGSSP